MRRPRRIAILLPEHISAIIIDLKCQFLIHFPRVLSSIVIGKAHSAFGPQSEFHRNQLGYCIVSTCMHSSKWHFLLVALCVFACIFNSFRHLFRCIFRRFPSILFDMQTFYPSLDFVFILSFLVFGIPSVVPSDIAHTACCFRYLLDFDSTWMLLHAAPWMASSTMPHPDRKLSQTKYNFKNSI